MRRNIRKGDILRDMFYMLMMSGIGAIVLQMAVGTKEAFELALK